MILYLRFKIYEFIAENENKLFSKDFTVKLGNLLPLQYETENGGNYYFLIKFRLFV